MAMSQDYTKMVQDMMGAFPIEATAFQDMFKNSNAMTEKFASIALEAADKSTNISTKWARDTLAKMGDVTAQKNEIADYGKAITDFSSAQTELASQNISAFVDIAKQAQMDAAELLMVAGKAKPAAK